MRNIQTTARLLAATSICMVYSAPAFAGNYGITSGDAATVTVPAGNVVQGDKSGVYSTGIELNLTNEGTIRGNGLNAFTSNTDAGVAFKGGPAHITNSGTISGARFGITSFYYFTNFSDPNNPVWDGRTSGSTLNNSGSIIGDSDDGVRFIGGGSVTNSGYIAGRVGGGADGISMFSYVGQDLNSFAQIGTVNNLAGGTIEGNRFGIIMSNGGSVTNAGTISGNSGSIHIQAQSFDPGRVGTVNNTGTLNGSVSFNGLASASVTNSGGITGAKSGIVDDSASLTVNNSGTIRGNGLNAFTSNTDAGIAFNGGAANITNSGAISGARFGISSFYFFTDFSGPNPVWDGRTSASTLNNSGSIIGDSDDGVRFIGGGTITNSGYIAGRVGASADGISMFSYEGQNLNSFTQIGTVTNLAGGTIEGNRFGVILSNGGTVNNAGTIRGNAGGVLIQAQSFDPSRTGMVTNSGAINGQVGFFGLASATLNNSGSITTVVGPAVDSESRLSLVNSGTIIGAGPLAVQFGAADDSATLLTGSAIVGALDGAIGYDRAILSGTSQSATPSQTAAIFLNFEDLLVQNGYWTAAANIGTFETIAIDGGTLHLTGSLTGNVSVGPAGNFIIGNGGTTGNFTGNLANNGLFTFNRSDDTSFAGVFSGSGSFTKLGQGTLTFTGSYGFTGQTNLLAGGLVIGGLLAPTTVFNLSGGTLQLSGNQTIAGLSGTGGSLALTGGGTLLVQQANDTVFGGSISGDGSLTKDGGGLLSLTGASTYTGSTVVSGGTLSVNGSITSDVIVNAGATLGGSGTTGNVTVNEGGTFNPGNSIGTIAVAGNLMFGTGSIYAVETNPSGASDRINASGSISIATGASVAVLAGSGNYSPQTSYTILSAGGAVIGKFDSVTSDLAFLTPKLVHKSNSVMLLLIRNGKTFASASATNNSGAAGAVEGLGASNTLYNAVIDQSAVGAKQAFAALSGSSYADLGAAMISDLGRMELGFAPAHVSSPAIAWRESPSTSGPGFHTATSIQLGKAAAMMVGGRRNQRLSRGNIQGDISTQFFGAALAFRSGGLQVGGGVVQSHHEVSANRTILFPSFAESTQSHFRMETRQMQAETSYSISAGPLAFAPYANYSHTTIRSDSFGESGGAAALSFDENVRTVHRLALGARATTQISLGRAIISPRIDAALQQSWGDLDGKRSTKFAVGSSTFDSIGEALDSQTLMVDAGIDVTLDRISFAGGYRVHLGENESSHSAQLSATLRF